MGDQICCNAMKTGFRCNISITNAMIDMYVKCGSLETARKLFDSMENPNVFSWSSLIVGYAQFGDGEEARALFRTMRVQGVRPNPVTIVGVLTACNHVGLVEEGRQLFSTMEVVHGIVPTRQHCSCVVDLLARTGRIDEAEAFINQMQFEPDVVVWKNLLSSCKTHNNIEVGERAAESILKIDPFNSAALLLPCNIYASTGSWKDVTGLRSVMKQRDLQKSPGHSKIAIKDRIHVCLAEYGLNPERHKIYSVRGVCGGRWWSLAVLHFS